VTASDGQEAVEKAQQERPDLILMDVVMPRMNGFEACKMIRQQSSTHEIPIVLVTTRGEESYMEAGFQSGCNDYITKPVNGAEPQERDFPRRRGYHRPSGAHRPRSPEPPESLRG